MRNEGLSDRSCGAVRCGAVIAALLSPFGAGCAVDSVQASPPVIFEAGPIVCEPVPPAPDPLVTVVVDAQPSAPVLAVASTSPEPAASVSVTVFEETLAPYGEWIVVGSYGRVWRPIGVPVTFRPYTYGHWIYTDCGWTFVADDPWGTVVYHYGRWALVPTRGWVWVPGSVWAPAWVSWRECDDFIGWAPLPPESSISVSIGFAGCSGWIHDDCWSFVPSRSFLAPHVFRAVCDSRQNVNIINKTKIINHITVINQNVVRNDGPAAGTIERLTHTRVAVTSASRLRRDEEARFLRRSNEVEARVQPTQSDGETAGWVRSSAGSGRASSVAADELDAGRVGRTIRSAPLDSSSARDARTKGAQTTRSASKDADAATGTRSGFAGLASPSRDLDGSGVAHSRISQNRSVALPDAGGSRIERPTSVGRETTPRLRERSAKPVGRSKAAGTDRSVHLVSPTVSGKPYREAGGSGNRATPSPSRSLGQSSARLSSPEAAKTLRGQIERNPPPPRVEGKAMGSGSAATPRPVAPAASGVVIRRAGSGPSTHRASLKARADAAEEQSKSKRKKE